jgi:flagellar biosynthesis protein FlhG
VGVTAPLETHYDVLGIGPRAGPDEVERAYRHALSLYDEEALATYSLLAPDERRACRARVQAAYEVLREGSRRHEYDVRHGFASAAAPLLPFPSGAVSAPVPEPPEPRPVVVLADPVTGPDLRRVREGRGVSLRDIATTSKVGVRFLEYIEGERFDQLPAPVYLRGFVQEYARAVGLDPRRTADSYLAHVRRPGPR